MRLVQEDLILGEQERLHFADIAKIFVGQLDAMQSVEGLADHLLGALLLRREDDVAQFAIAAHDGAGLVEFVDVHALAIRVVALGLRGFGFALRPRA